MDLISSKHPEESLESADFSKYVILGQADSGGDCFFDSLRQCLEQIRPEVQCSIKSLRQICRNYGLQYDWVKLAVAKDAKLKSRIEETINDREIWQKYLLGIEYSGEDIEVIKDSSEHFLYTLLTECVHGDTLIAPIWGRCEIEGRIICDKYGIKLHVIEKHKVEGNDMWAHQIIDGSCSKSADNVNYNEENLVHLINMGDLHFRPLLLKKYILSHESEKNSHQVSENEVHVKTSLVSGVTNHQQDDVEKESVTCGRTKKSQKMRFCRKKGTAGASGHFFEIKLLAFLYLKGLSEKIEYFYLASNLDEAETFDDIIFKYKFRQSEKPILLFIQTKHRSVLQNKDKKKDDNAVTEKNLFSVSQTKLSLQKRFSSYLRIRKRFTASNGVHPIFESDFDNCSFIIYSNHPLTQDESDRCVTGAKGFLKERADKDCVFNLSCAAGAEHVSYYRVNYDDDNESKKVFDDLTYSSDCMKLARELAESVFIPTTKTNELEINLTKPILRNYRIPLAEKVFEKGQTDRVALFRQTFLNDDESLSGQDKRFRRAFFREAEKLTDETNDSKSALEKKTIKITRKFWNTDFVSPGEQPKLALPSDSIEDKDVKEFFSKLKLFLDQPNQKELGTTIKRMIVEMFRVGQQDIDSVFSTFMDKITKWWEYEDHYLTENEDLLENILRVSIFTVGECAKSFTGREEELNYLHSTLQPDDGKSGIAVISHMTSISGLGGIGKTELARKYAWDHKSDYDGNVMWINAESYGNLCSSFLDLAKHHRINISTADKNGKEKSVELIVREIYDFFGKRKSLFIFDNAERPEDVKQFIKVSPLTPNSKVPYILITSRVNEWGSEVDVINLNDLKLVDAMKFVANYLISRSSEGEEIRKLATTLQCFPLALQQAVAYIADQRVVREFSILDYLKEYGSKTGHLLASSVFPGISNDYTKTTYTTWQITMDKIGKDKNRGCLANDILHILAYLPAENIERDVFYSFADEKSVIHAVRVLAKYSMIDAKKQQSLLSVHRLVQYVVRLNLEEDHKKEERILRQSLKLLSILKDRRYNTQYIASIWSFITKHGKLIEDFCLEFCDNVYGKTPLRYLAEEGNFHAAEAILGSVRKNHSAMLKDVINGGNYDIYGTVLHTAVRCENLEAVKYLVSNGAAVNAVALNCQEYWEFSRQDNVNTKCICASARGFFKCTQINTEFSPRGLRYHATIGSNVTPLDNAAYIGNEDIAHFLIGKGANVDGSEHRMDIDPLKLACLSGNFRMAKLLLDKGANLNVCGLGVSPLDAAAASGNLDLVKHLITAGADAAIKCDTCHKFHATPLHIAAIAESVRVLEYLLENGAKVNAKNLEGQTPLHCAAEAAALCSVKYLIDKDANLKCCDNHKKTPLHLAAERGHLAVVRYLSEKGASFQLSDYEGNTPLHAAARACHFEVVKFMAENGADFKSPNKHGDTPANIAAAECCMDVLKFLVEKGAHLSFPNNDGRTPIHLSIERKENSESDTLEVVRYIIDEGRDFTSSDNEGYTPLELACMRNKFEVAKMLLEEGADFSPQNKINNLIIQWAIQEDDFMLLKHCVEALSDLKALEVCGNTPTHIAAAHIHIDGLKYLIEKGADFISPNNYGQTPMHLAARANEQNMTKSTKLRNASDCLGFNGENEKNRSQRSLDVTSDNVCDAVRILIENGATVEALDLENRAPIHYAAEAGNVSVLELLIENKAHFMSPDRYGFTPLSLAAKNCHTGIVQVLLGKGVAVNIRDNNGKTPIHHAAAGGNASIVRLLIEKGADLHFLDRYGCTPLHLAAIKGRFVVVQLLLEKGADVEIRDNNGMTPIHHAAAGGNTFIVKLLTTKGSNVMSCDSNGYTPLHLAAMNGHHGVVYLLLDIGVDVNIRDQKGKTPIHQAVKAGHASIVNLLVEKGTEFKSHGRHKCTPLHLSAVNGHADSAQLFLHNSIVKLVAERRIDFWSFDGYRYPQPCFGEPLKESADVNISDESGKAPIHQAAESGYVSILKFLIEKGADFKSRGRYRCTPLHLAAVNDHIDSVLLLLRKGANINTPDENGKRPIHEAAEINNISLLEFLINKGADFKSRGKYRCTPIDLAAMNGHTDSVELLLEKGARAKVSVRRSGDEHSPSCSSSRCESPELW